MLRIQYLSRVSIYLHSIRAIGNPNPKVPPPSFLLFLLLHVFLLSLHRIQSLQKLCRFLPKLCRFLPKPCRASAGHPEASEALPIICRASTSLQKLCRFLLKPHQASAEPLEALQDPPKLCRGSKGSTELHRTSARHLQRLQSEILLLNESDLSI